MSQLPTYSTLFSTLHDEQSPIGYLGRGTHYSILRSVEWMDIEQKLLEKPQIHDFSVIWDEDHDTRIIEAIEQIYLEGLLSPVQFIGERKGNLTVIVAALFYSKGTEQTISSYKQKIDSISQNLDDAWPSEVRCFDRAPGSKHQCFPEGIINDSEHKVIIYLKNIDSLWNLGTKNYQSLVQKKR